MAWVKIRQATDSDYDALNSGWTEFCTRHPEIKSPDDVCYNGPISEHEISNEITDRKYQARYLTKLWRECRFRLIGSRDGIALNYVGYHLD